MTINRFGITSTLAGVAAAVAIAVAPAAAAAKTEPTPVYAGDTTVSTPGGDGGAQAAQRPEVPSGGAGQGAVALPPGGPVAVLPQDQGIGGTDPYVPFGTDPYVPFGVWAP